MFVRVRDVRTRHQFDVPHDDPRIGDVFVKVNSRRYPPVARPRPQKYQLPKRASQKGDLN